MNILAIINRDPPMNNYYPAECSSSSLDRTPALDYHTKSSCGIFLLTIY